MLCVVCIYVFYHLKKCFHFNNNKTDALQKDAFLLCRAIALKIVETQNINRKSGTKESSEKKTKKQT